VRSQAKGNLVHTYVQKKKKSAYYREAGSRTLPPQLPARLYFIRHPPITNSFIQNVQRLLVWNSYHGIVCVGGYSATSIFGSPGPERSHETLAVWKKREMVPVVNLRVVGCHIFAKFSNHSKFARIARSVIVSDSDRLYNMPCTPAVSTVKRGS
jgi:hypothetical protein